MNTLKLFLIIALSTATSAFSQSALPGTIVSAQITTGNTNNTYSIGDTALMTGTPKAVGSIAWRDAITPERRAEGMICVVTNGTSNYAVFQLVGGVSNSNWALIITNGSSVSTVSLVGGALTQTTNVASSLVAALGNNAPASITNKFNIFFGQYFIGQASGAFQGDGGSLVGLNASAIQLGTVPIAHLGDSGTKDTSTFLRGDNTFAVPPGSGGGGSNSVSLTPIDNSILINTIVPGASFSTGLREGVTNNISVTNATAFSGSNAPNLAFIGKGTQGTLIMDERIVAAGTNSPMMAASNYTGSASFMYPTGFVGGAYGLSNAAESLIFPFRNANQDYLPQAAYNGWPGLGVQNATETNVIAAILLASNLNMLAYYPNFVIQIDDGGPTGRLAGVLYYTNFTGGTLSNVARIAHLSGGPGHPNGFKIMAYDEPSPNSLTSAGYPCSGQGTNLEFDAMMYARWGLDGIKMDMESLGTSGQGDDIGVGFLNRAHAAMLGVTNKQYYFTSYTWFHTNENVFTKLYANNAVLLGDWTSESGGNPYQWWALLTNAIDARYSEKVNIPNVTFGFSFTPRILLQSSPLLTRGVVGTMAMLNRVQLFIAMLPSQIGTFDSGESYFELYTNSYLAKIQQDKKYMAYEVQKTANSEGIFKRLSDGNFALELLNRRTNSTQTISINLIADLGLSPGSYTFVNVFTGASFVNSTNAIGASLVAFDAPIYYITPNSLAGSGGVTPAQVAAQVSTNNTRPTITGPTFSGSEVTSSVSMFFSGASGIRWSSGSIIFDLINPATSTNLFFNVGAGSQVFSLDPLGDAVLQGTLNVNGSASIDGTSITLNGTTNKIQNAFGSVQLFGDSTMTNLNLLGNFTLGRPDGSFLQISDRGTNITIAAQTTNASGALRTNSLTLGGAIGAHVFSLNDTNNKSVVRGFQGGEIDFGTNTASPTVTIDGAGNVTANSFSGNMWAFPVTNGLIRLCHPLSGFITSNSTDIVQWTDASGAGNHLTTDASKSFTNRPNLNGSDWTANAYFPYGSYMWFTNSTIVIQRTNFTVMVVCDLQQNNQSAAFWESPGFATAFFSYYSLPIAGALSGWNGGLLQSSVYAGVGSQLVSMISSNRILEYRCDDERWATATPLSNASSVGDAVGTFAGFPNYAFQGNMRAVIVFNRAIAPIEYELIRDWVNIHFGILKKRTQVVCLGDSITAGFPSGFGWPNQLAKDKSLKVVNFGEAGAQLISFTNAFHLGTLTNVFNSTNYQHNVLMLAGGVNDAFNGVSANGIYNALTNLVSTARGIGYDRVIVSTFTGNSQNTSVETVRTNYNFQVSNNFTLFADGIANVASDAEVGGFNSVTNTLYFFDNLHPSVLGYEVFAKYFNKGLNDSLNVPVRSLVAGGSGIAYKIPIQQSGNTNGLTASTGFTIAFTYAMPSTNYTVNLVGDGAAILSPIVSSKTTTGFSATMTAFSGNVDWSVTQQTQ